MKYYLIGIKDMRMSALALLLNDLGYEVIGYDDDLEYRFTEETLLEKNIKIYTNSNIFELDKNTIVVRSTLIKDNHPEMQRVFLLNLKHYQYQEMLGRLSKVFETIGVAGSHGKTTTASMLVHVLNSIKGCNYIIDDGQGYANKDNKTLIMEVCEYQKYFLNYQVEYAIITNIEMDHTDCYKDMSDMISTYQEYANKAEKMVIVCGNNPYTRYLEVNKPLFYYGIDDDSDIVAKEVEYRTDGISFDVLVEKNYYGHFDLPLFGKHMLLNSLAVIAVCYYERLDAKDVFNKLKTFKIASKKFKETAIDDNIIVDNYTKYPTEIKVTIKALKQKYPNKKIIVIFEPYTFSRIKEFHDEFVESLNIADYTYVMNIDYDCELPNDYPDITSYNIINSLKHSKYIDDNDVNELLKYDNTVILFMGSKKIYLLENLLLEKLQ
ncbi:MAG: Mur ligase family protein [Bacilli bacterium]